jgi:hypothetical protein
MEAAKELTAGPELDARIAAACGLKGSIWGDVFRINDLSGLRSVNTSHNWFPSRSIEQAFDAADIVGLFEHCSLAKRGDNWHVYPWHSMPDEVLSLATAKTAPLAICAAILAGQKPPTIIEATDVPASMLAEVELPGMKRAEFVTVHHDHH